MSGDHKIASCRWVGECWERGKGGSWVGVGEGEWVKLRLEGRARAVKGGEDGCLRRGRGWVSGIYLFFLKFGKVKN